MKIDTLITNIGQLLTMDHPDGPVKGDMTSRVDAHVLLAF